MRHWQEALASYIEQDLHEWIGEQKQSYIDERDYTDE